MEKKEPIAGPHFPVDFSEVSELKRLLIQAGKMAELGIVSASLAHELKQPLVGIKSFVQMLLEEMREDGTVRKRGEQILKQALRMEELLTRMQRFSHTPEEAFSPVNVNEVIEETLELLRFRVKKFNVNLEKQLEPNGVMVEGDFNQLQQVFFNLIDNGLDALEGLERGILGITIRAGDGRRLVVYIYDTGDGIHHDDRERVFQPFFTTKDSYKGTGLGLFISRAIVEAHSGTLEYLYPEEVEEPFPPGVRTVFRVMLPLSGK